MMGSASVDRRSIRTRASATKCVICPATDRVHPLKCPTDRALPSAPPESTPHGMKISFAAEVEAPGVGPPEMT